MILHVGDALTILRGMPDESVHCCVTSPPYWGLRDYGVDCQLGLEKAPEDYVKRMVEVFREIKRVLRNDGTLWLNLGDSYAAGGKSGGGKNGDYWERAGAKTKGPKGGRWSPPPAGFKQKDLVGIPWMVAFALRADGWYLRQDIIWHKPNPMPESVRDRFTKSHEYLFLLSKAPRYHFDGDSVKEKTAGCKPAGNTKGMNRGRLTREGWSMDPARSVPEYRNRRSVWKVTTVPFRGAHFATFPPKLVEPCVLAGCPRDGVVLDPFAGTCTTGFVAAAHGREFVGIELNPAYAELAKRRVPGLILQTEGVNECRS